MATQTVPGEQPRQTRKVSTDSSPRSQDSATSEGFIPPRLLQDQVPNSPRFGTDGLALY